METNDSKFKGHLTILAAAVLLTGCASAPLYRSAGDGDLAKVQALIASGANPNVTGVGGLTPLHAAVIYSHLDVAKYLLEHGADPNFEAVNKVLIPTYCGTPLIYAACAGRASMVQLLLDYGADPDPAPGSCGPESDDRGTPLQLAEKRGNTLVAQIIKQAILAKAGITRGGAKNAGEYGPLVGGLLKDYKGEGETIAVAGFSYADGHVSTDGGIVAARLTTELIKLKKLKVVERNEIEKVLGELKLQNTGALDADSAKKIGKMLGADFIVVGTMTELPGGKLELNARMVGVESGVAISAVSGQVRKDWK